LGHPRQLIYAGSLALDKNWVPWNGTTRMSYSQYGTFGPHSVFDWRSYDEPAPHAAFDAVAHDPLFPALTERLGGLLQLAGGVGAGGRAAKT
jgi:hypothetical protein